MSVSDRRDCAEVVLLLPWLASGAIDSEDRRRVEAHLEACATCRAEAERCRVERARLRAEVGAAPAPHPAQLERLLARLDTDEGEDDDAGAAPPRRRRSLLARTPAAARWLIAAQLVALAGLGFFASRPAFVPGAAFRTLSAPAAAAPARGALRVVFAPEASEAEVRALLLSVRAQIVAGPSALGVYTLALDGAGAPDPVGVALGLLRADARVRLAEAVAGDDAAPR